jgi:hypothetical protein
MDFTIPRLSYGEVQAGLTPTYDVQERRRKKGDLCCLPRLYKLCLMYVDLPMLGWYPHHRNVSVRMGGVDTGLRATELRDASGLHLDHLSNISRYGCEFLVRSNKGSCLH